MHSNIIPSRLKSPFGQYAVITGNYWAFTLTDGALRMLVLLHFYQLGFSPFAIASLFLFYEFFGIATNLLGGWLGAKIGLNKTMNIGLGLQIIALSMLIVPTEYLTTLWVMAAQALSGIAKDLNKMSAKSAIKTLLPANNQNGLFRWVALLTGSKNALKGVGFFLGGALLSTFGFTNAVAIMAAILCIVWLLSLILLQADLGKSKKTSKFSQVFSKSRAVNVLAAARLFLFAARDIWFVIALPVYLSSQWHWSHWKIGSFLALWVIGYGIIQATSPRLFFKTLTSKRYNTTTSIWAFALALVPLCISLGLTLTHNEHTVTLLEKTVLLSGLAIFAVVFAVNSALHSFLIVNFAKADGVSLDVGFYYMANACGRLLGTVLSGWAYQAYGLNYCLYIAAVFLVFSAVISLALPKKYA